MSKIHVVSHSHWDREWYRPFQYFKIRLTYFMDQVLSVLETNPEYKYFMLDGQTVMIEDYLDIHPENRSRLEVLIRSGRLIVGPWYSQPDEFVPSGESLVRNLLLGIRQSEAFGACMRIGYLPDAFGQCCQMPQILSGFDIHTACMMRGVPIHQLNSTEFMWEGLNGDSVLATALATGYSNGMFMPSDPESLGMRFHKATKDLQKLGNDAHVLVMNGVDHQFIQPTVSEYIIASKKSNSELVHTTLEAYFDAVSKDPSDLVCIKGEMISPVTNRVHTSIASSRIYQKTENRRLELQLTHRLEPVMTMAYALGADYPTANINSAWKLMFQNQTHDGLCGCCTDEVHKEIDQRFVDVSNITNTLGNMFTRSLAESISNETLILVIYNHTMVKGRHMVEGVVFTASDLFTLEDISGNQVDYEMNSQELIDAAALSIWTLYLGQETPVYRSEISLEMDFNFNVGYHVLNLIDGNVPTATSKPVPKISGNTIATEHFTITVNTNGTIDLFDKDSKTNYADLNAFEDCGCAGDTYNYSPVLDDLIIKSNDLIGCQTKISQKGSTVVVTVDHCLMVPESLSEDGLSRSQKLIPLVIHSEISLKQDSRRIDFKTTVNNTPKDHRLRVLFPTGLQSDYSYSDTQFGVMRRSNTIKDAELWQERGWSEKPLPIYSQHRFVAINDGTHGVAILNRGLTEYEIYEERDNTIAVTLLRGVGMMGKPNLLIRPGRPSGIPIPTPDAQCLGEHTYEYSIFPHKGPMNESSVVKEASIFTSDIEITQNRIPMDKLFKASDSFFQLYEIPRMNSFVVNQLTSTPKDSMPFIDVSDDRIMISALKKSDQDDAIVIRLFNATSSEISSIQVKVGIPIEAIHLSDFGENKLEKMPLQENRFIIESIKGNTAMTYKIYLTRLRT